MALDLASEFLARPGTDPALVPLLRDAGIRVLGESEVQFLKLEDLPGASPHAPVALTNGLWPGVSGGQATKDRDDETASASREPWVDANGYWIPYLQALYPRRPPVLAYPAPKDRSQMVPVDSLELALIEARVFGGNYILSFDPRYKEMLLRKDPQSQRAWGQFRNTLQWLHANDALFRQPPLPAITLLVEPGGETAELANLLFRRNASPALAPAAAPPAPDSSRIQVLVAANLQSPAVLRSVLPHAAAGASIITTRFSGPNPERKEDDRDFYTVGKGRLVAYHQPIADPSEFALDVIDILTHKRRALRMWNAPAVIGRATRAPDSGALLHAINYGSPIDVEFPARIQGKFTSATLLRPDAAPAGLKTAHRDLSTEVVIPALRRVGVVHFRS